VSRLWEKGLPLDQRVLRYTAGEDHLLDARLVECDVRGSIAHAEMLADQGLIDAQDCKAIVAGLHELLEEYEAGRWQIRLEDEDVPWLPNRATSTCPAPRTCSMRCPRRWRYGPAASARPLAMLLPG
jgi:hypothetical protein